MSVQEFMAYRQGAGFRMKVSMELVLHCAPILKDVKPANIVAVTPEKFRLYVRLLSGTEIAWLLLNVNKQRAKLIFPIRTLGISLQNMAIGAESLRISLQGLQRELSALAAAR